MKRSAVSAQTVNPGDLIHEAKSRPGSPRSLPQVPVLIPFERAKTSEPFKKASAHQHRDRNIVVMMQGKGIKGMYAPGNFAALDPAPAVNDIAGLYRQG